MSQKKQNDFAAGFKKLQEITEWFEREDVDLEEALKKFEDGLALAGHLKKQLADVEAKVVKLKKKAEERAV